MTEISVSGCGGRGNDRYTLRKNRHFQFFIQSQYSFFFELHEYLTTAAGHIAQRIGRVDIENSQTVTVEFVKLDCYFHQDFDAGSK